MTESRQAITQLRDELAKREKYWTDWNGRAANRAAKLEAAIAELQAENDALRGYVKHNLFCPKPYNDKVAICTCGLDELLNKKSDNDNN